jgi:hypothetical protein
MPLDMGNKGAKKNEQFGAENLALYSMYAGVFALAVGIVNFILNVIPFGGCLQCLLWPVMLAGFFAFLGAIGLGIAALMKGVKENQMKAIIGLVLAAICIFLWVAGLIVKFIR